MEGARYERQRSPHHQGLQSWQQLVDEWPVTSVADISLCGDRGAMARGAMEEHTHIACHNTHPPTMYYLHHTSQVVAQFHSAPGHAAYTTPPPPCHRANTRFQPTQAVVVLVVASDGSCLLTQRAAHMRTFPHTWVTPGGGVDPGEDLATAAAREVLEETSVIVAPADFQVVGFFESVYPPLLDNGSVIAFSLALAVLFCSRHDLGGEGTFFYHSTSAPPTLPLRWLPLSFGC
jgi:8-oxo-dGTP pyrophosphatase MutT (NUDIX family)